MIKTQRIYMLHTDGVELRHLRYFITVAEERSFTRAAHRLNMAQPPLSQAIRKLEHEIGGELLARNSRHVELTEAGRTFLEFARVTIETADRGVSSARRVLDGELGELKLGFVGTTTYDLMPFIVRAYTSRYPEVSLHLSGEHGSRESMKMLDDERVDIAVTWASDVPAQIESRILRTEPLMAVLPESHWLCARPRIQLADLAPDRFIAFAADEHAEMHQTLVAACGEAGFTPSVKFEVNKSSGLVSLVASGLGVALVPSSARFLKIAGATYRPLEGCSVDVQLMIAWRSEESSPAVLRAVRIIRELVSNFVVPFAGAPMFGATG